MITLSNQVFNFRRISSAYISLEILLGTKGSVVRFYLWNFLANSTFSLQIHCRPLRFFFLASSILFGVAIWFDVVSKEGCSFLQILLSLQCEWRTGESWNLSAAYFQGTGVLLSTNTIEACSLLDWLCALPILCSPWPHYHWELQRNFVGRGSEEVQSGYAPLRRLFPLKYISSSWFLCDSTCCFEFQGKFIATYKYSGYYYGLGRDTVESIAREGLATCVHLEIEVRIPSCRIIFERVVLGELSEFTQCDWGLFQRPWRSLFVTQETSRGHLPSLQVCLNCLCGCSAVSGDPVLWSDELHF